MGNVKANWHIDGLDLPEDDPFAPVAEVGQVIDLSQGEAELHAALVASVDTEARFHNTFLHPATMEPGYVACDMKWEPQHRLMGGDRNSCFACPHYTEDELAPHANICVLGRQQEMILAQLDSLHEHGTLDDELAEAFERDSAAADELAEAMLVGS